MMNNKKRIITVLFIIIVLVISFFAEDNSRDIKNIGMDSDFVSYNQQEISEEENLTEQNETLPDIDDKIIAEDSGGIVCQSPAVTDNLPDIQNSPEKNDISDNIQEPQNINDTTGNSPDTTTPEVLPTKADDVSIQSDIPYAVDETNIVSSTVDTNEKVTPAEDENTLYCTLSVNCISAVKNQDKLKKSKKDILPKDGIIFREKKVEIFPDESAFDILQREMKNNKIQIDFVSTPMYNSIYIKGIANLYEFDCGDLSGWMYKVNGVAPTYGCSQYKVKNKDKIEFFYTYNRFE